MKNAWGSVKVYVRHSEECEQQYTEPDDAKCHCSKWLYENQRGQTPKRRTLNTYSWAEAQKIALTTLEGFNPEVAEARHAKEKLKKTRMTVDVAFDLWYGRKVADLGEESGSLPKYRYFGGMLRRWAERKKFISVQTITALDLERWQLSDDWRTLSEKTQHVGWGLIRNFFGYLLEREIIEKNPILSLKPVKGSREHVQGPYTDKQIEAILAAIPTMEPPDNISVEEKRFYRERLTAYLTLLLHSGCDLIDAVLFTPDRIKEVTRGRMKHYVLRYRRKKTGTEAIIPLDERIAKTLLNVPSAKVNAPGMPFRYLSSTAISDAHKWGRKVGLVLSAAGVEYVTLPATDDRGQTRTKPANAKQFRHTFAVQQLRAGQRPEDVAKMMGHVDATMVRKHYAPWVPDLDEAHINRILAVRKK